MGKGELVKLDIDKFEEHIKAIRDVSERMIDENVVCPEPSPFMADNPIIMQFIAMEKAELECQLLQKAEQLLFADRLQDILDNFMAIDSTSSNRISAKVAPGSMRVSSKRQIDVPVSAPVSGGFDPVAVTSNFQDVDIGFMAPYLTGNDGVDAEIVALFLEYGEELSELQYPELWNGFSDNRKKAIAQIFYTDMNLLTTQWPADTDRLNVLLTFFHNTEHNWTDKNRSQAFNNDRLEVLEGLIPNGRSNARDLIELMKSMEWDDAYCGDGSNSIRIKQQSDGIRVYVYNCLSDYDDSTDSYLEEKEIGFYEVKAYHYLYTDYLTEDVAVNNEIKQLFEDYGANLDGLAEEALDPWKLIGNYWNSLSINKQRAIARVLYKDMARIIDDKSINVRRAGNILTLFQNGDDDKEMAFNVNNLNGLINVIYGKGNTFMDVERKLSMTGDDSVLDVLNMMLLMTVRSGSYNSFGTTTVSNGLRRGHVRIGWEKTGISFSICEGLKISNEMGLYFNQERSSEYLTNLLKENPKLFDHFKSITGYDMDEAAQYIRSCITSDDLMLMTGLLTTDGNYDFMHNFNPLSNLSSSSMLKFVDYLNLVLNQSFNSAHADDYKLEYINIINAALENQSAYEYMHPAEYENAEGYRTLLNDIYLYSFSSANIQNGVAWTTAELEARKDLGIDKNLINTVDRERVEDRLATVNMNATVWKKVKEYYEGLENGVEVGKKKSYSPQLFCNTSWGKNEIDFISLTGINVVCFNGDFNAGEEHADTDIIKEAYSNKVKQETLLPVRCVTDSVAGFLSATCPEFGVPVSFIVASAFGDNKAEVNALVSGGGLAYDNKLFKGAGTVGGYGIKTAIDYYNLDANYDKEIKDVVNDYLFNYGGSYTANGIQVIEYANMYELSKINYAGVDAIYGLGTNINDFDNIKNNVYKTFTTEIPIINKVKCKYSDKEIISALKLILYGNGSIPNEMVDSYFINGDNNYDDYEDISKIPLDLRSQCFTQISSYARNNHKNKIDLVTEFNIAVGNIDIDE